MITNYFTSKNLFENKNYKNILSHIFHNVNNYIKKGSFFISVKS